MSCVSDQSEANILFSFKLKRISDAKYISCPLLISLLLLGDYILFIVYLPYANVMKWDTLSNINKIGPNIIPSNQAEMTGLS